MDLIVKEFNELTTKELYEILQSRAEIFIMEQDICYQDMDNRDYDALHCFFMEEEKVIAYLRAFYIDRERAVVKMGRVLTLQHGAGIGKKLMKESIAVVKSRMNCRKLCIDAQTHAIGFYEKLGLQVVSDEFWEEGVLHVKMEMDI